MGSLFGREQEAQTSYGGSYGGFGSAYGQREQRSYGVETYDDKPWNRVGTMGKGSEFMGWGHKDNYHHDQRKSSNYGSGFGMFGQQNQKKQIAYGEYDAPMRLYGKAENYNDAPRERRNRPNDFGSFGYDFGAESRGYEADNSYNGYGGFNYANSYDGEADYNGEYGGFGDISTHGGEGYFGQRGYGGDYYGYGGHGQYKEEPKQDQYQQQQGGYGGYNSFGADIGFGSYGGMAERSYGADGIFGMDGW